MYVVATAGHVDHGKSALVRALTGQEPDRLAAERERGLTIELGYVWTDLPGVGEVAFVDVPGHEHFVTTALAGLGPVPIVLFVVAADDPWMPQAAEHLAALDALGVRHGVLAVTRCDLADPAPSLRQARAELARTSLAGCRAVVVSARTGQGLPELRGALAELIGQVRSPDPAGAVRLWVDRAFHVTGAGLVVTGTLPSGTVRVGDELETAAGGRVRVRALETLGRPRPAASAVARVAVRLGRTEAAVRRGSVLVTPGAFEPVGIADVALTGPEVAPPTRPMLHLGSHSVAVHLRPLGDRWVRLTLPRPLPLRVGDAAVLRDPGSRQIWGVRVVDPLPRRLQGRGSAARRAAQLATLDGTLAAHVADRQVLSRRQWRRLGATGEADGSTVAVGDWLVSADQARAWRARLGELAAAPEGILAGEAAQRIGVPDLALIDALVQAPLSMRGGRVVATTEVAEQLRGPLESLRAWWAEGAFRAPDQEQLRALGLDDRALAVLARDGAVLALGGGIVLAPGADRDAVAVLGDLAQPFTVSEARRALDTTRRVVLPLLAQLDRAGLTLRLADDRRRVR